MLIRGMREERGVSVLLKGPLEETFFSTSGSRLLWLVILCFLQTQPDTSAGQADGVKGMNSGGI